MEAGTEKGILPPIILGEVEMEFRAVSSIETCAKNNQNNQKLWKIVGSNLEFGILK